MQLWSLICFVGCGDKLLPECENLLHDVMRLKAHSSADQDKVLEQDRPLHWQVKVQLHATQKKRCLSKKHGSTLSESAMEEHAIVCGGQLKGMRLVDGILCALDGQTLIHLQRVIARQKIMGRGCTRPQTVQGNSTLQHVGVPVLLSAFAWHISKSCAVSSSFQGRRSGHQGA